ncbi:bifunctional DNA primase/polymerase [Streptomyces sp. LB8]|uniref:bifunctional DNA primase/polymerase n=1 Tax=Streptomyces sp. LB8 TaxID=3042509 RepID=UPI002648B4F0|nr:bifunctional DNA primase/polymerase [Streptomyces sp. LB8]MDN5385700.1 bifunctional DNA primase/polymerase [Streptomyces sp. LB8]
MQRMTRRGMEWLSQAADDPAQCLQVWADDPRMPCLLATGRLFDVVSVEQRLGLEMFDRILRSGLPFGPSLIDRKAQRVGFFLGSQSRETFTHYLERETPSPPPYRYLGEGSAVVVPGPIPLSGDRYQWLRAPMRRPAANPLRPVALATALVASAELLARIDRFDEQYPTPYAAVTALPEETTINAG